MIPTPSAVSRLTTLNSASTSTSSRTADGSSRMSSLTECDSARAIETTCCWAGRSDVTDAVGAMPSSPSRASSAAVSRCIAARFSSGPRRRSWPRNTFRATDRCGTRSSSW